MIKHQPKILFYVSDIGYPSVTEAISEIIDEFQGICTIVGPTPTFSGNYDQILGNSQTATGIIAAEDSQICNIQNAFIINAMT